MEVSGRRQMWRCPGGGRCEGIREEAKDVEVSEKRQKMFSLWMRLVSWRLLNQLLTHVATWHRSGPPWIGSISAC